MTNPTIDADEDAHMNMVDVRVLGDLARDTSPDLIPELVESFLEHAGMRVGRIRSALDMDDCGTVAQEAHTLSSSAATFGAAHISWVARDIEDACKQGEPERIGLGVEKLVRDYPKTEAALREAAEKVE